MEFNELRNELRMAFIDIIKFPYYRLLRAYYNLKYGDWGRCVDCWHRDIVANSVDGLCRPLYKCSYGGGYKINIRKDDWCCHILDDVEIAWKPRYPINIEEETTNDKIKVCPFCLSDDLQHFTDNTDICNECGSNVDEPLYKTAEELEEMDRGNV